MTIRKITQVLTVLFSVSLVLVFIGFRGGYFMPLLAQQTKSGNSTQRFIDRLIWDNGVRSNEDSLGKHREMLWSSKSSQTTGTFTIDSSALRFILNLKREIKRSDSLSKIKRKQKKK